MSSGKANYSGDIPQVRDVTPTLKVALEDFKLGDEFVQYVLAVARDMLADIAYARMEHPKDDLQAEHAQTFSTLKAASEKLRNLSLGYVRLFPPGTDTAGLADSIDQLVSNEAAIATAIQNAVTMPRAVQSQQAIAIEMVVRVLGIAQEFGIKPTATYDPTFPNIISDAVRLVKIVGDEIGIVRGEVTWRKIIIDAKRQETAKPTATVTFPVISSDQ
jgi:hypothetical protein